MWDGVGELVGRFGRQAIASLVLGLLAVFAWPLAPWTQVETHRISITATGGKDPQAKGSEVWLTALPGSLDAETLLASRSTPDGWEMRDGVLVSFQGQPSTFAFEGPLDPGGGLTFVRHPWSGEVRIEINGQARTENLFDPASDAQPLVVALAEFPMGAATTIWHWPMFLAASAGAGVAIFLGLGLLGRLPVSSEVQSRFSYTGDMARYGTPALAIFLIVLLGTWPAQMSPDSVSQWWQLASGVYGNAHPLLHTLLIGGFGYLLGSPGWSILLQIVLLALACGALAAEIRRWTVSEAATWAVAFLVPLLPGLHLISTVLWKDVPYAAAIAALTAMTMALLRSGGGLAQSRVFLAGFALVLFLVATLRHNGILVAAGDLVVLAFVMLPQIRRPQIRRLRIGARLLTTGAVAGVVLPLVWSVILLPALGVPGLGRHYGGIVPMHLLGGMLAAGKIEDQETLAKLDAILPLADWRANYDCLDVVPLFWAKGIRYEKVDASLFGPALRASLAAPKAALKHILCMNSSVWRLSPTEGVTQTLVPLGIWRPDQPADSLGLREAPVIEAVGRALKAEFAATTGTTRALVVFWRPAFMFLLLGLCAAFALLQNRRTAGPLLIACAPVLLNTLSMVPLAGSQDFRYQLPVYLVGPFLMAAAVAIGQVLSDRRATERSRAAASVRPQRPASQPSLEGTGP